MLHNNPLQGGGYVRLQNYDRLLITDYIVLHLMYGKYESNIQYMFVHILK